MLPYLLPRKGGSPPLPASSVLDNCDLPPPQDGITGQGKPAPIVGDGAGSFEFKRSHLNLGFVGGDRFGGEVIDGDPLAIEEGQAAVAVALNGADQPA